LCLIAATLGSAAFAQNNEQALLRALNAQVLQFRGAAASADASAQSAAHSRAADALAQRQQVLQSLMASAPARALELAFPGDVLADLAATFPESASLLEERGRVSGTLYYVIEDGIGFASHREVRKLKVGEQMIDLYAASGEIGGSKCNDRIAASGVRSGGVMVVESSTVEETAAGCSNQGAQKIAVILANFTGYPLPAAVTPEFLQGVLLGNAATNTANQSTPDRSVSDFWMQNSDGKTWVNNTGTGALAVVTVNIANFNYCSDSGPMRAAAYAAADGAIDYNQFSRVVIVVPHNGTCSGTAGVASIGCWGSECPGDGACNISWTWWRADQISLGSTATDRRGYGTKLSTHEFGHNLGISHSGSRYHGAEVVQNIGVAGTRTEYNDVFSTMGNWNLGFYNAPHSLNTLGWLTSSNVQTVTGTGVYTIQGFETRPAGIKALKIARGTGTTNAYFYLAYYPDRGDYIGSLNTNVHNGALIHYNDSATPALKTDLLDFTPNPSSSTDFGNPVLPTGSTWTDPYKDVQIQVNSVDTTNNTMTVTVTYSPPPCTPANPTVTFLTSSGSTSPGGSANYPVQVLNNDSISCAARNFDMAANLTSPEPTIGLSYANPVLNIAPGTAASTTLTATTTAATPLGTYVINATATSGAHTDATDTDASLTVQNIPPATPTGVSATSVYSGSGKNKVFQYIRFSWGDVANETGYEIQRCKVSGKGNNATCVYALLASVPANTTSINDVPATSGTYRYQVRAVNTITGLSSGWSAAAQASR
jgi:hypothetical protein